MPNNGPAARPKTIALLGALDTKGAEYGFVVEAGRISGMLDITTTE
jgi:hypothetical protein